MPYALIPDGFTLKRVTSAQQKAVDEKRSHDDVLTVLGNPATAQVVSLLGAGLATAHFLPKFIEALETRVGTLGDDFKNAINETVNDLNPLNLVRSIYGGKTNEELIDEMKQRALTPEEKAAVIERFGKYGF